MRRKLSLVFMGGLTISAMSAFNWQYNRYYQSLEKWANINKELQKDKWERIAVQDLNLKPDEVKENIFQIISVNGFVSNQIKLVRRFRNQRDGNLVISSIQDGNKGFILNLGWVPQENVKQLVENKEFLDQLNKKHELKCLIRYGEVQDELSKRGLPLDTFINLEKFAKEIGLTNTEATKIYLERMGDEKNSITGGFLPDSEDEILSFYPWPIYIETLDMPYLTPDKHKSYFTFWAGCSLLGIYSLFKIYRR